MEGNSWYVMLYISLSVGESDLELIGLMSAMGEFAGRQVQS